ncbi:MAG TPA: hypothetical protein PKC23_03360 [Candidatus Desulfobacillus sp.]|nr:hypothetical protein [Candidatus Desulfobacillus sp.]
MPVETPLPASGESGGHTKAAWSFPDQEQPGVAEHAGSGRWWPLCFLQDRVARISASAFILGFRRVRLAKQGCRSFPASHIRNAPHIENLELQLVKGSS